MKISECQSLLTATLSLTRIPAPQGTPAALIASSVLEMARAYESDGIVFFRSDDPVNALAGFYYGFGWLHFGLSSGLLVTADSTICPFTGPHEILAPRFRVKLEEKATRYARLLDTARSSVICGPDPAAGSHDFARRILCVARIYASHGNRLLNAGADEEALTSFSYGHGWLDAGVAAGLFRITTNRDIFCV